MDKMTKIIEKKISWGTIITIGSLIVHFVYTQGIFATKMESFVDSSKSVNVRVNKNVEKIQSLEVSVSKIEAVLGSRFDRIEELLMDLD
tara:strand:- start:8272 stop:8538 length:267 start_codon:yes stop_codon:yes gene_type:complete